jgi:hypothetical protein
MAVPFGENGGFAGTTFFLFVPTSASDTGASFISIFDPSNFNDTVDGSSYSWRSEDIVPGRVPTVRRIILIYTDLGSATITATITGTNDNGNIVTASAQFNIGTSAASGAILTKFIDLTLTAFRPQLSISRAAGGGPVSIVEAVLIGEVEEAVL